MLAYLEVNLHRIAENKRAHQETERLSLDWSFEYSRSTEHNSHQPSISPSDPHLNGASSDVGAASPPLSTITPKKEDIFAHMPVK